MCQFFSFVTKGSQKFYFDWPMRKKLLKNNPHNLEPDSHSSISEYFKLNDDKVNKFEYNPLNKEFQADKINIKDNSALAKKWVEELNFKEIIEPLIIKPIIHPFKINPPEITEKHIKLLKQWASVRASVGASVWASVGASVGASVRASVGDSVGASVRDSVGDSVGASVWDSVGASVWASVWDSVWDSIGDSIRDSVGDSVGDSVRAYISSFFDINWKYIQHKKGINPFKSCIDLWELGLIPSFDGKTWRLHGEEDAKILYEINSQNIQ